MHQLDRLAGFRTPPTANHASPSGTMPTWNPAPVNFCPESAARCCALRPLANSANPSLLTRWIAVACCPRSGWIKSCLLLIDCRLPVCAGFGKAGAMRRVLAVLAMAAALAACPGPQGPDPDATPTVTPTPTPTATATAASNGARAVSEETDDFLFEFSYP